MGDEPRRVFDEISEIKVVDVILPTKKGIEIRKGCITTPTKSQAVLLERLGLNPPKHLENVKTMQYQKLAQSRSKTP